MKYKYAICSCALIFASLPLAQAENEKAPWNLIVQWDNDLIAGTDRDYTNGARVAFSHELSTDGKAHNALQKGLRKLSGSDNEGLWGDKRFSGPSTTRYSWGTGVTQLIFTPEDPDALTAPDGERPYAGWLGIEFSLHANTTDSTNSITLSVGTTGDNSFAQETQDWVHRNISGSPIFQGWDSQVPGEATLNLHFDRKQRIKFFDTDEKRLFELDGYYEWGASLGNFRTDAYVGGLLRFGHNLPASHTTPRVQLGSTSNNIFLRETNEQSHFSIFSFGGLRGFGVLHDITLDGPVFRDFDTGVDIRHLVGEAVVGVGLRYKVLEASLSHTIRTNEFSGQNENLEFGSIMLRLSAPF